MTRYALRQGRMKAAAVLLVALALTATLAALVFTEVGNDSPYVPDALAEIDDEERGEIVDRYLTIVLFPANNPAFIPSVIPLLAGLVVVAFYYGRYRYEELGWGAAFSNSFLMVATGMALLYEIAPGAVSLDYLIEQTTAVAALLIGAGWEASGAEPRFMVALGIILIGSSIALLDFFHFWPKQIAFFVSSGFTVYTVTYITIAWVYEELPLARSTLIAATGVILTSFIFVRILKVFGESKYEEAD